MDLVVRFAAQNQVQCGRKSDSKISISRNGQPGKSNSPRKELVSLKLHQTIRAANNTNNSNNSRSFLKVLVALRAVDMVGDV